jgi:hypothetical protein
MQFETLPNEASSAPAVETVARFPTSSGTSPSTRRHQIINKSIPAAASVIAAFMMMAPSGSQAKITEDAQISQVNQAPSISDAAAEAIKAKAKYNDARLQTAGNGYAQAGFPQIIPFVSYWNFPPPPPPWRVAR